MGALWLDWNCNQTAVNETIHNAIEPTEHTPTASAAEYEAMATGAAIRILGDRTIIRVTGDDRAAFLHGMCSNEVKGAKPGTIVPALILTEHAHIIADLFLWIAADAINIEIDSESWPLTHDHLEKLLVADDVEFSDPATLSILHAQGARAAQTLAQAGFPDASTLKALQWKPCGSRMIGRLDRFGCDSFSVIDGADAVMAAARSLEKAGAVLLDPDALEVVRIENGIARVGVDTNDKTLALEARMDRAISFNKGCYVGQETVERATARGGIKKQLFGLRFEAPVEPDTALAMEGREVGHVTSVAISPKLGPIGLAIIDHRAWAPGTELSAGHVKASVSDLPFGAAIPKPSA